MNRDALKAGEYPVRFQLVGPRVTRVMDTTITIKVPGQTEPPFAQTVFQKDVVVDGPPGIYRFLATFQRGAAAAGYQSEFYVNDPATMPQLPVVLWGKDEALSAWFKSHGMQVRDSLAPTQSERELIPASGTPPSDDKVAIFSELARRVARGSAVVFLTPNTLLDAPFDNHAPKPLRWLPMGSDARPLIAHTPDWYFHADPWAKEHPIFRRLALRRHHGLQILSRHPLCDGIAKSAIASRGNLRGHSDQWRTR